MTETVLRSAAAASSLTAVFIGSVSLWVSDGVSPVLLSASAVGHGGPAGGVAGERGRSSSPFIGHMVGGAPIWLRWLVAPGPAVF